ncbi:sensor histidine kinase [Enterococcus sp. LJL90]
MKKFFQQHILFPQRFGLMPYFILTFLIPTVIQLLPLDRPAKWFLAVLLLVFLKAYRDGYEVTEKLNIAIVLQLIIALIFGIFLSNGYLFVFTAWEIGSLPIQKSRYYQFLKGYYLACAISLLLGFLYLNEVNKAALYNTLIALLFAISSPIIARSVNESNRKNYRLHQTNQRLEAIIRQGERERIARDLHDNLGQVFSIITMKSEVALKLLEKKPELVAQELQEIATTSRNNLTMVRTIVENLQERSIAKTLIEEEKNLQVTETTLFTQREELAENWPLAVQDVCSAIIKEAITNIIRHSQASFAEITFNESQREYQLQITDNGVGFKTVRAGSFGLQGMTNRVESVGGELQIDGETSQGTQLILSLPKLSEVSADGKIKKDNQDVSS